MSYQSPMNMGMYDMNGYGPQSQSQFGYNSGFNGGFNSVPEISLSTDKGKGRLHEDFEAAFAAVAASMTATRMEETARISEVDNDATLLEAAMHNVSIDDAEKVDSVKYGTDFQTCVSLFSSHVKCKLR